MKERSMMFDGVGVEAKSLLLSIACSEYGHIICK